jgi:hypothetical protein
MLIEQLQAIGIPGYRTIMRKNNSTVIVLTRNDMIVDAPNINYDFLFFIDDDVGFPLDEMNTMYEVEGPNDRIIAVPKMIYLIKRILDHNKDICAGYYCGRSRPHLPMVFKFDRGSDTLYEHILEPPESGLHEVDSVATGFLCIKKKVFEKFREQFETRVKAGRQFEQWKEANGLKKLPKPVREYIEASRLNIFQPFWLDYVYDPFYDQWRHMGEDTFFCREAKRLGFKIWVDFDVNVGHQYERFITADQYRYAYMNEAKGQKAKEIEEQKARLKQKQEAKAKNG